MNVTRGSVLRDKVETMKLPVEMFEDAAPNRSAIFNKSLGHRGDVSFEASCRRRRLIVVGTSVVVIAVAGGMCGCRGRA